MDGYHTCTGKPAYDLEDYYTPLNQRQRPDMIEEKKFNCEMCEDTGEVTVDEQVYPGEPHTAPIGTRKCICQLPDEDDYDNQE